jgi:hypothetical protein
VISRSIPDLAEAYRSGEAPPSAVAEEHQPRVEVIERAAFDADQKRG